VADAVGESDGAIESIPVAVEVWVDVNDEYADEV